MTLLALMLVAPNRINFSAAVWFDLGQSRPILADNNANSEMPGVLCEMAPNLATEPHSYAGDQMRNMSQKAFSDRSEISRGWHFLRGLDVIIGV